jgi:hypothetical protein
MVQNTMNLYLALPINYYKSPTRKHSFSQHVELHAKQTKITRRLGKNAIITLELVDESVTNSNDAIAEDLLKWLRDEAVPAPWVKEIKKIFV